MCTHTHTHTSSYPATRCCLARFLLPNAICLLFPQRCLLRYTLLKGLELSKAAAQGLNKVLGDKHEKSRDAKDVYRDFLSKKQVLLPSSPSASPAAEGVRDSPHAGAAAGSPMTSSSLAAR